MNEIELVLPRSQLSAVLFARHRALAHEGSRGELLLATGVATRDASLGRQRWLLPRLARPGAEGRAQERGRDQALWCVGYWPAHLPWDHQRMLSACQHWHGTVPAAHAPGAALPDTQRGGALLIGSHGRLAAAFNEGGGWRAVQHLHLPGAGMEKLQLGDDIDLAREAPGHLPRIGVGPAGRYSRPAGALGADALARMQASIFAVVGLGRTGSAIAHSLVRMGASAILLDTDTVEPHNLDGDLLLPEHEGLHKVEALAKCLLPLVRAGAFVDARVLDVASPCAGALIGASDVVISAADNDRARFYASMWASAWLKPHVDVGVAVLRDEVGADVRLVLPGRCLHCHGGYARPEMLAAPAQAASRQGRFGVHRAGSLRSVGQVAAHLALRLVEQLYQGKADASRFVRVHEGADARIALDDRLAARSAGCELCDAVGGSGSLAAADGRFERFARGLAGAVQ